MSLVASTRREYYVANIAGILIVFGLLVWSMTQVISSAGIKFASIFFWLGMVLLIALPYTLIGFFSSMKAIEVTAKGLVISYVFQKHKNYIKFSEIATVKTKSERQSIRKTGRSFREAFSINLADGRSFEFERGQLKQYDKLKAVCIKQAGKRG